uniref:ZP domain-containing protein n=1 Tax=Knipowitschia caucasica TaxID=637954 RepID=A0AAV2KLF4_KNICA
MWGESFSGPQEPPTRPGLSDGCDAGLPTSELSENIIFLLTGQRWIVVIGPFRELSNISLQIFSLLSTPDSCTGWSSFIMLSLLLCLSALAPLAGAVTLSTDTTNIDISACPIKYFGAGPYSSFDVAFLAQVSGPRRFSIIFNAGLNDLIYSPPIAVPQSLDYDIVTDVTDASLAAVLATLEGKISRLPAASAVCAIKFSGTFRGAGELLIVSYNIDGTDQAAAYMSADLEGNDVFIFYFNGGGYVTTASSGTAGAQTDSQDLTRCRAGLGKSYKVDEEVRRDSDTCSIESCLASGDFQSRSICATDQVCMGKHVCGSEHSCSIVANSVVAVSGATAVIPDFCAYDIVSGDGLVVTAILRERRYKDTPFVDSVKISTTSGGTDIVTLLQGGKAELKESTGTTDLTLSSTVKTQIGLSLYDHGNGPLASFTDSDGIITEIFFEGTLLHVKHTVPSGKTAYTDGVCFDATDITGEKVNTYSSSSCGSIVSDSRGDGITCSNKQNPPYVKACADNLLCGYHDGDDLYCRFKQAYARTADLDSYDCSASVCLFHECASHEFCAVALSGDAACFCRSLNEILNGFRDDGTYGPDATCDDGTASVSLIGCLLVEEDVNLDDLHLKDDTCTGQSNGNILLFTFDTQNPCGATSTVAGDKIQFDNAIQNTIDGQITRENSVNIKFSCSFEKELDSTTAFSFQIKDGSITQEYTAGDYTFPLTISVYSDAAMTEQLSADAQLEINQKVYVKLEATDLGDSGLVLVINKCFTTTDNDPEGANVYSLIDANCPSPTDGTVLTATVNRTAKVPERDNPGHILNKVVTMTTHRLQTPAMDLDFGKPGF